MELVLWVMPLHVAPVVSYDMLRKGMIERPKSGLDRFNLTDVGARLVVPHLERGGTLRIRDVRLPFPWKAELVSEGPPVRVDAMTAGGSTFRSIMRISFEDGDGHVCAMRDLVASIGRDPLSTPYWDLKSWESFHRETGLTFDEIRGIDERTLEALGVASHL